MGGSSVNNKPPEGILVTINKVEGSGVIFPKIGGSSVNCRYFITSTALANVFKMSYIPSLNFNTSRFFSIFV